MWTIRIVQLASRLAVLLLVLLDSIQICMAVGWIPLAAVWGDQALHSSAVAIVSAAVLVGMAAVVDKRASEPPNKWMQVATWLVTVVVIVLTTSYWTADNVWEKWVLGIMCLVVAVGCAIVASSTPTIMATPVYEAVREAETNVVV